MDNYKLATVMLDALVAFLLFYCAILGHIAYKSVFLPISVCNSFMRLFKICPGITIDLSVQYFKKLTSHLKIIFSVQDRKLFEKRLVQSIWFGVLTDLKPQYLEKIKNLNKYYYFPCFQIIGKGQGVRMQHILL